MVEEQEKKFGQQAIGIHGQEMPKYGNEKFNYWEINPSYKKIPKI